MKNKTVLITGTSSGFGKSAAKLFAANGWNVIATMRSPEKEQELSSSDHMLVLQLDVQDDSSIQKAITSGIKTFGTIDVLVNNAGYAVRGIFESLNREQIRKQFDVNVFGLMDMTHAIIPHFRENGKGLIINISSMGGIITLPLLSLYHSTKFAVEGFSEALSYELSAVNIGIKLIEPGSVKTNFGSTSIDSIPNTIPEYDDMINYYTENRPKVLKDVSNATPNEVAEVIYKAANDDTKQFRYVVGGDAEFYIYGKTTNDDEGYLALMNSYFLPPSANQ